jgi:hypothetical protein
LHGSEDGLVWAWGVASGAQGDVDRADATIGAARRR